MSDRFKHLRETLEKAPTAPGVYMMKDAKGTILYIGKAKSLRSRVRSYFQESSGLSPRIALMVAKVRSIDMIVTSSELEALVLEDNLVKKEQPRFNVLLKDDKNYPYLKLTMEESFPRLILVRRVADDGGMYFGPYVSGRAVRTTMRLIHKIFPLRQSKDVLDGKPPRRPCLNYQMGRCLAPCAGKVSREEYRKLVGEVALFLKGRNRELIGALERRMTEAAENERFELAARYRDQIAAIRELGERQSVTDTRLSDEDVIASYEAQERSIIKIFQIRRGKMNAEREYLFGRLGRLDRAEALGAFIRQFYGKGMEIPPVIIVNEKPDGAGALEERLSVLRGGKTRIVAPERGRKKKLAEMAERNAKIKLDALLDSSESRERALDDIKERFGLAAAPKLIEGYDISNTSGVSSVGAIVVFRDGEPSTGDYRKYTIRSVAGPDDYASISEVVERRHRRLSETAEPFADLLVIDGGKGQVGAVARRFEETGVPSPPIIGVAKGRDRENPETDEFFVPGRTAPVDIPASSPGRLLLQRVRDEAHRFAISFHRKARGAAALKSSLDETPGIGPKRKKALLRRFGSVKRAREATIDEIREALSVSEKVARKIHENL